MTSNLKKFLKSQFFLLSSIIIVAISSQGSYAAPITYDEAVDGDLPNQSGSPSLPPSVFFTFDIGVNSFTGTMIWGGAGVPGAQDTDIVPFIIPSGLELISVTYSVFNLRGDSDLVLTNQYLYVYNSSYGNRSVIGSEVHTAPFSNLPYFVSLMPLSEGIYSANHVGATFSPPITFNTYAEWDWTFEFTVGDGNPVPEPATILLLGSGFIGIAIFRRKRGKG